MATDTGIASGAIANCTDGADEVPIVKWEAQALSFDGVSSVKFNHCNKNLIMPPVYDSNDMTLCLDLGTDVKLEKVTMSFLATNAVSAIKNNALVDYRESDGTHHYVALSAFRNASDGTYFDSGTPQNGIYAATSSNFKFRYIYIYYCQNRWNKFSTNCLSKWQIEVGNTRTDFVNTLKSSDTAHLGRTVYGAKLNLTSGTGTENMVRVKISDLSWTYYTGGTNPIFYATNVPNMKTYARAEMPNVYIDRYTTRTAHSRSNLSTNMANMECSAIENAQTITFRNDTYTSRDDMLAAIGDTYIIYETTQTTDFTFNPILKPVTWGVDNFWIDCGDSEVEYYKSGYGYTSVTLNRPTSKNWLNPDVVFSQTDIYTYNSSTGEVTVLKADASAWSNKKELKLLRGTYVINNPQGRVQYRKASENYATDHNITSASGTITMSTDDAIKLKLGIGATYPFTASYQLEIGSEPTTFEKYSAVTKTAKLHRLIYEGSVDVIRGIGTISVGESGTEYDPPESFTFPPVSFDTIEGEQFLFASEGASALTYRKAVN